MDGVVAVASVGFSVDLIMRRLVKGGITHLIAVGLDTGDDQKSRVESTYSILKVYLNSQGITSELRFIRLEKRASGEPELPVRRARDILAEALARAGSDGRVELILSGGPRLLVVGLLIAALTMRPEETSRIRVHVYGEGFPGYLEQGLAAVRSLCCLDPVDRGLLELISQGYNTTQQLLERSGLPRSTLFKRLRELRDRGLLKRDGRGLWSLDEDLARLL